MSEAMTRVRRAWPVLALLALASVFALMLFFSRKAPVIASLEPAMAAPGETVTLTGDYFGRNPREGSLSIAGEIPPPSLIRSWSDQKIVFDVPEDAASGLVTVANSQGTSHGVLFTNTESIPTVLQTAAPPGTPLVTSILPSQPVSGQIVVLSGRGFGTGSEGVVLKISTGGPLLTLRPEDTVSWSEHAVSFVLPSGVGPDTTVRVSGPAGESSAYALKASSPLAFGGPRTVTVEFRARADDPRPSLLWGPVPQTSSGTVWTADGPTTARWNGGAHELHYRLTLTTWAKAGSPSGIASPAPPVDTSLSDAWKPAAAALKAMTAGWGLDVADPWQKLQRLQTGLSTFRREVGSHEKPELSRDPAQLLAGRVLNSFETSALAAYLGGQAGLTVRLIAGLWIDDTGVMTVRTWTEAWLPGGWMPWDPVDGNPGRLDARHFAFETVRESPPRRLPRSSSWGWPAPATLGDPSGETVVSGAARDTEPVVRWEFTRVEK